MSVVQGMRAKKWEPPPFFSTDEDVNEARIESLERENVELLARVETARAFFDTAGIQIEAGMKALDRIGG